jgi:hypothetical protein
MQNDVLRAEWRLQQGRLSAPRIQNRLSGEVLQPGTDLFVLALQEQQVDEDWVYLGLRIQGQEMEAVASMDGQNWTSLAKTPRPAGKPLRLRVGKTDKQGGEQNYVDAGEMGTSEFLEVRAKRADGSFITLTGNPARIHKSSLPGTELAIHNERGTLRAAANHTAFSEYPLPADTVFVSARIRKGTDQGMSWGPGLSWGFSEGGAVGVNVRQKNSYNVLSAQGEQIVPYQVTRGLNCELSSNAFVCGELEGEKTADGVALRTVLTHAASGLQAVWRAELRDGSSYIRQTLRFSGSQPRTLYGLQLLAFQTPGARQAGRVPGSPVVTDSFFTGIELPVTVNYIEPGAFRSGFACRLPLEADASYAFATVVGVVPEGQLRRAFQFYLERERALPSAPFLHYNCWYDFAPTNQNFLDVIAAYGRELTDKRGVVLDSFVMDDGWDNYREGLWAFNRQRFPEGFTDVAAASQDVGSNLGVWISPLGGYGGANERTQHARDMGLITDQLDLSQPGYYEWFRDKCLEMMRRYSVNYFKWDKAGSGVDPHFMALLRIAGELKEEDPGLYLNVTVGTWPSPFWLNHIDCTWRDGSADVAWAGKGDRREQWLTYRDQSCYRLTVQQAPLYPLNSLMHHGLVLGHHYQGKTVAEAGADMKNAARSYFGSGPNLQELYLSPDLMTPEAWDQVAEAIRWNQRNAEVLVDAHWVGGDPGNLEVYGWAAWYRDRLTLTLRNPDDREQTFTLEPVQTFELPAEAPQNWELHPAYADQGGDAQTLRAGERVTFTLKPFEVLVFDGRALKP